MNAVLPHARIALNRFGTSSAPRRRTVPTSKLLSYANRLHKDGNRSQAETIYRTILSSQPNNPVALLSLGIVARQSDDLGAAEKLMKRVIELAPHYHQAHCNLAGVYVSMGRFDDAVSKYRAAIELMPDYAEAHFSLGTTLRVQGRYDEALDAFFDCRKFSSQRADVHYEIGQCELKRGNRMEAQIAFGVALNLDPDLVNARNAVARLLSFMGKHEDALTHFRHALNIAPDNIDVLNGLSETLRRTGHLEESLELLERALPMNPHNVETLLNLGTIYQVMGDLDRATRYYEKILEILPDSDFAEKSLLYVALNQPHLDAEALFALHRRLRSRHDRTEARMRTFVDRSRNPDRKLRIGFISSDFRTHVVALNVLPLLCNMDRSRFEIFLYAQEKSTDHITEVFRKLADRYIAINRYDDAEAARLIENDGIDILITLAGRFDENRPLIAAHRAAPIQVSFHDCATSGLEAMDYYLTDEILHPADTPERFTEQLYRLPVYYQYPIQDGLPEISRLPALDNGYITFGSFNKPEKLNDDVVSLWADVLRAVPGSKLLLKYFNHYSEASMRQRWIKKFAEYGIEEERLILKAKIEHRSKHLAHYSDVDIALDPFPFNGATTTFESLSMGIPVVTLLGRHFVDRVAASMLGHIGRPEWIAVDRGGYVAIARDLAGDLVKLAAHRSVIREQLHTSPLCQGETYARSVEAAFRDMWRTWVTTGGYRGR